MLRHEDENCFWTDTYFSTSREMEALYQRHGLKVVDHFAQDGMTPQFAQIVDRWDEGRFRAWCDYHFSVCREPSTLGAGNHVVIVGRK